MLGGSSAINGEALIAQSKAGVDAWTQLGNSGWDWETLAPYYAKSQTITLPDERLREHLGIDYSYDAATGTSGPIQASFSDLIDEPLTKAWIDTFKTLNAKATGDPFSGQTVGGFSNPSTIDPKTKTRSYAATAYYLPAKDRPNLFLKTGATVEKVLLDDSNGNITATGVQYVKDGNTETAVARKEVILSASAILTPKLLELSGIGNPDILKAQSIPVVVENRNVGENLQDHVMGGISFEVKEGVQTVDELARGNPEAIGAAMQAYQTTQSGAFAMGGVNSNAFMPLADCLNPDERANPQNLLDQHLDNHPSSTSHHQHSLIRSILSNPHEGSAGLLMYPCQTNFHNPPSAQHNGRPSATSYLENLQSGNFFTLGAVLLHPFSRGSVHIGSADPNAAPVLDPKYLSHPLDIEILARYTQFLETLAATEPLASYIRPNGRRNARAAEANIATDVAATKEYLRDSICSIWHPVGTCAMMPREAGGVVDERLRVLWDQGVESGGCECFSSGHEGESGRDGLCGCGEGGGYHQGGSWVEGVVRMESFQGGGEGAVEGFFFPGACCQIGLRSRMPMRIEGSRGLGLRDFV